MGCPNMGPWKVSGWSRPKNGGHFPLNHDCWKTSRMAILPVTFLGWWVKTWPCSMVNKWSPTGGWKDHSLNHLVGGFSRRVLFPNKIVVGFVRVRKNTPHKRPLLYLFLLGGAVLSDEQKPGGHLVPGRVQNDWSAGSVFCWKHFRTE